jgi:hypothetical protein
LEGRSLLGAADIDVTSFAIFANSLCISKSYYAT